MLSNFFHTAHFLKHEIKFFRLKLAGRKPIIVRLTLKFLIIRPTPLIQSSVFKRPLDRATRFCSVGAVMKTALPGEGLNICKRF